jgi:hypothetical protein
MTHQERGDKEDDENQRIQQTEKKGILVSLAFTSFKGWVGS